MEAAIRAVVILPLHNGGVMKTLVKIAWGLTAVAAILAAAALFMSSMLSRSAPQQAAGAATALGIAVIPYILAKALDGLSK
jgi:hypothetical protein